MSSLPSPATTVSTPIPSKGSAAAMFAVSAFQALADPATLTPVAAVCGFVWGVDGHILGNPLTSTLSGIIGSTFMTVGANMLWCITPRVLEPVLPLALGLSTLYRLSLYRSGAQPRTTKTLKVSVSKAKLVRNDDGEMVSDPDDEPLDMAVEF